MSQTKGAEISFEFDVASSSLMCNEGHVVTHARYTDIQNTISQIKVFYTLSNEINFLNVSIANNISLNETIEKLTTSVLKMKAIMSKMESLVTTEVALNLNTTGNSTPTGEACEGTATSSIDWHDLVYQEQAYRRIDDVRKKYSAIESDDSYPDWSSFTAPVIQPHILSSNGVEPNAVNLHRLRVAAAETDVFWVKHNRARKGHLNPGDPIPSQVTLFSPHLERYVDLHETSAASTRPWVLLAGSIS
jgi:hypothetical protein